MTTEETNLGVVARIEEAVEAFEREHKRSPSIAVVGRVEWEILGATFDDEFTVDNVPVTYNDA